jgi:hypothetical protein
MNPYWESDEIMLKTVLWTKDEKSGTIQRQRSWPVIPWLKERQVICPGSQFICRCLFLARRLLVPKVRIIIHGRFGSNFLKLTQNQFHIIEAVMRIPNNFHCMHFVNNIFLYCHTVVIRWIIPSPINFSHRVLTIFRVPLNKWLFLLFQACSENSIGVVCGGAVVLTYCTRAWHVKALAQEFICVSAHIKP